MKAREDLHQIVDALPENELPTAQRVLEALRVTGDPVLRALFSAPVDDESDEDDLDGGLSEARREAGEGQVVSHEEALLASLEGRGLLIRPGKVPQREPFQEPTVEMRGRLPSEMVIEDRRWP